MTSDDDNNTLARLMKLAGERAEIPLSVESRVYNQVKEEWQSTIVEPNGDKVYGKVHKTWRRSALWATAFRWLAPAAIAAAVLIGALVVPQPEEPSAQVAATVSRLASNNPPKSQYPEGAQLYAGETINTGPDEGLSLLLAQNESFRIDAGTRIRIDAVDRFTLFYGRVYADTGQFIYRDGGLKIATDLGIVSDIGTQFSVTSNDGSLEVAVREGRVDVDSQQDEYVARMGERLTLAAGEAASVTKLDTHGAHWDWVTDLAPGFDLTNKSLLDFLKWAARETGRELQFQSDESRMFAMRTDVHGSIDRMTPDEALAAILATTTLRYRIQDDKIVIEN